MRGVEPVGAKMPSPVELRRQRVVDVQQHLAGAELRLVRAAIRLRQLWVIGDERLLHTGHFFGQLFERAAFLGRRRVALCHGPASCCRGE